MDQDERPERLFSLLAREIKSLALNNIQYFQNGKQSYHAKFHVAFSLLREYMDVGIEPSYLELCKHLHNNKYDFSDDVKGNGYRSLLKVVSKCCVHLLHLCKYISSVRDSILFRKRFYSKELESYVSTLGQLRAVLYYALKLINYCHDGELFADEDKLNTEVADQLVIDVESLCQESFYGRCLGFQFCESMQRPMHAMAIAMASYSEGYLETSQMMQVATSVFNSGKYILDPELRAQQVVKVTRTADIKFCKAFWGFTESSIMQQTFKKSGKSKTEAAAKSTGLILHIHGGGFVAQSSRSHEVYLRDWAVTVDVPILSVDYSLAPEFPFPRALEECFYAYAWAVQNCEQLGSTGEKIVVVGDSAGGNLAISTAMRAASFGIRTPDGVICVYPCTVVRYTPSPARLLSLLDPVLPVGLVTRCLAAYAGINEEHPLSTPKTEDVHSEESLTCLKLGSYESSDKEWVIIAQGQDGVSTCNAGAEMPPGGADKTNNDEMFSQLLHNGSCVFPSGVSDGSCGGQQAGMKEAQCASPLEIPAIQEQSSLASCKISNKEAAAMAIGRFQERAKVMMEGAHNFFSSFIPSGSDKSVQSSLASFLHPKVSSQPVSDSVDLSSASLNVSTQTLNASQQDDPTISCNDEDDAVFNTKGSLQLVLIKNVPVSPDACFPAGDLLSPMSDLTSSSQFDSSQAFDTALSSPYSPTGPNEPSGMIMDIDETKEAQSPQLLENDSVISWDKTGESPSQEVPETKTVTSCEELAPKLSQEVNLEPLDHREIEDMEVTTSDPTTEPQCQDIRNNVPAVKTTEPLIDINLEDTDMIPSCKTTEPMLDFNLEVTDPIQSYKTTETTDINLEDAELKPSSKTTEPLIDIQLDDPDRRQSCKPTEPMLQETLPAEGVADDHCNVGAFLCHEDHSSGSGSPDILSDLPDESKLLLADAISDMYADQDPNSAPNPSNENQPKVPTTLNLSKSSMLSGSCTSISVASERNSPTPMCSLSSSSKTGFVRSESAPVLTGGDVSAPFSTSVSAHGFPHTPKISMSPTDFGKISFTCYSPLHKLRRAAVVKNPYMSPLLAPDDLLQGLTKVCIVACHLDPLLDDSVSFAKRLKALNVPVELHLIDDLPHGFLNFALLSFEAKKASEFCSKKIADFLQSTGV
ncbi:uncharacterized protein LOC131956011 isoform X2 [Physella acuta]|uniref:uncharacterized protein LOC131956011 isoform X2 n=1 Tax=Physella acuta TaxID=109671 RepID=UPI0027DC3390|nr:uncharacterized protein LOC131956011 isoform X2 [Physella acuta]